MVPTITHESLAAFARRCGVHRSTVCRWRRDGKIVVEAGRVAIEPSLSRLAAVRGMQPLPRFGESAEKFAQAAESPRDADKPAEAPAESPDSENPHRSYWRHRAAAERERAELLRLDREEREGSLVDAEAVRSRTFALARAARDSIMSLPARLDPVLAAEADRARRAELWDAELRRICAEIARGVGDE